MTKEAETQANMQLASAVNVFIQATEPLDDCEKHRVLDTVYAFYGLRADPTFRMSDIGALVERVAEFAGQALANSGGDITEALKNLKFDHGDAPSGGVGADRAGVEVLERMNVVTVALEKIIPSMLAKADPKEVADQFLVMLDFLDCFGLLPEPWVNVATEPECLFEYLAKVPTMAPVLEDKEYTDAILDALRVLFAADRKVVEEQKPPKDEA